MPGSERSARARSHRQLERAGEHPGEITRPLFNQLFPRSPQTAVSFPVCPFARSPWLVCNSMEIQMGSPCWGAPQQGLMALPTRAKFQTSGYSTGWCRNILQVATSEGSMAQFSAPISFPAKSAFFLVRAIAPVQFLPMSASVLLPILGGGCGLIKRRGFARHS